MSIHLILTLVTLLVVVIMFLSGKFNFGWIGMFCATFLCATGVLSFKDAYANFASTNVVMVGAMFILAGALGKTTLVDHVRNWIMSKGTSGRSIVFLYLLGSILLTQLVSPLGVIAMLLPLHGFVWRKELGYLLHKYDLWSRYEPEERGVLIAYASVYGNTENAANILACRLSERGVKVQMFDTSVTPTSYILSAAFRYSHLVFAATTYNAGVFITMEELLHDIAAHDLQNRRVVLLENGSWAPASGKGMQKILQPLKGWQQMEDTFTIRSALREDQTMQLERLAATLAADVQAAAPAEEKPEGQHRYVCKVCGYVYEGDSLPEDYKCPLCGAGAEYFKQES